jgi:acyl-coenzyme A thioesterase PaaI-like protein
MDHRFFKFLLNVYPPYWGTGIAISKVTPDFREVIVRMNLRFYNRNYVKTHFGGSLYAMTDPFYMLMLIQILGKDYVVWDKAAKIEFIKPGKGTVTAVFKINSEILAEIHKNTKGGEKFLLELPVNVTDEQNETVATVLKTVYIRKKNTRLTNS